MIHIFNEHGRLIGVAFRGEPTPPPIERQFFDERGRLIASVIVEEQ